MKLINLTPHDITIITEGKTTIIPPSGISARCMVSKRYMGAVDGIPLHRTSFEQVEGLPGPQEGIGYIVSSHVAQACKDRNDLYIPDNTIRNANGRVIGCRGLAQVNTEREGTQRLPAKLLEELKQEAQEKGKLFTLRIYLKQFHAF